MASCYHCRGMHRVATFQRMEGNFLTYACSSCAEQIKWGANPWEKIPPRPPALKPFFWKDVLQAMPPETRKPSGDFPHPLDVAKADPLSLLAPCKSLFFREIR